jgi:hypothetical protein
MKECNFNDLLGKTLVTIKRIGDEELIFYCDDNTVYKMFHEQDCCESVTIEDICGDLLDLLGLPLTMAEESSNEKDGCAEHETWTYYKLATEKGYVTIRWYGTSNGYYSEAVSFYKIDAVSRETNTNNTDKERK